MTNICSVTAVVCSMVFLAACGTKTDSATADSANGGGPGNSAAGTAASQDHSMNRAPAKDADHEFLRMMSDHHEGMIQMATAAMSKGSNPTVQDDAHRLHTKQLAEQKEMLNMVQSSYAESVTPMAMGSNKTMLDQLNGKSGSEYDRAFYSTVVAHHREGIKMIDDFLGRLTKAEVRQMAEKMKADQQKEITEFERKSRG
jgi:uncharacterized protein (DUF305 family)